MTNSPNPADLPSHVFRHLIHSLCGTLPPPPTDHPDACAHRDQAAIACVAALAPANAAEAMLAVNCVCAAEQGWDCLRLARLPETDPKVAPKCCAQAFGMMRQANAALRLLLRLRTERRRAEGNPAASHRAAPATADPLAPMQPPPPAVPPPNPPPTRRDPVASPPLDKPAQPPLTAPFSRASLLSSTSLLALSNAFTPGPAERPAT